MSDSPNSNPGASAPAEDAGVLAGLPRARPQRPSARRAAARAAGPARASRQTPPGRPTTRRATPGEPVPRQGYEADPEVLGGPVQPPGAAELAASAAELAGELAKSGVTAGARLLKDILTRLPG